MRTRICVVLILAITTAACSPSQQDVQQAVLEKLKDPESAKFDKFELVGDDSVCLEVNAKNGLGGYTGKRTAVLTKSADQKGWFMEGFEDSGFDQCVENFKENLEYEKSKSHPENLFYTSDTKFSQQVIFPNNSPVTDDTASLNGNYYAGKLVRCRFTVGKKVMFSGPCRIAPNEEGGFQLSERADLGYFAYVLRDGSSANAYWNGERGYDRAQTELGQMTQAGACWQNKRAEICVWSSN